MFATSRGVVRRFSIVLTFVCAAFVVAHSALAQPYPSKPVRIIVPHTPGGSNDVLRRMVAACRAQRRDDRDAELQSERAVPYKGNVPALTDLLGGQVDVLFSPINSALPHIKSGKLRALAMASDKRVAALPDVPTLTEAGVAGYKSEIWIALFAPARTPKDIVDKLSGRSRACTRRPTSGSSSARKGSSR